MFLDEKRHGEVRTETPSLRGLIAWLETKDPDAKYDYCDPDACLLCQYFRAQGFTSVRVTPATWKCIEQIESDLPDNFDAISNAISTEMTYGHALDRARTYL